jgi:cytochrome c oxidase subunit 2
VVSEEAYQEWLNGAIEEYAGVPQPFKVAEAD